MSHDVLNVTLTGTSNRYLATSLPTRGEITLFETGRNGTLIYATFRVLEPDGRLSASVQVPDPEFTYSKTVDREILARRVDAERAIRACWTYAYNEELRCPDCGERLAELRRGAVGHSGEQCSAWPEYIVDTWPAPAPVQQLPDCGDRASLEDAIRCALRDAGEPGATVEDINAWIVTNRSGGPLPRQVLLSRLAQLDDVRSTSADPVRRFHLTTPAAGTVDIDATDKAIINAVAAGAAGGTTVVQIAAWVESHAPHVDMPTHSNLLGRLGSLVDFNVLRRQMFGVYALNHDACTHGGDCVIHARPDLGLHNLDQGPARPSDPGDRFTWTAGNGTVRTGRVLGDQSDGPLLYVKIFPQGVLTGYNTWLPPADLVLVIEQCAECESRGVNCNLHRAGTDQS